MNFLIDYDTRLVECKSADREELEKYIADNDLQMATTIISEEDDFLMEMSLEEVSDLFHNYSSRPRKFENEEEAAEVTFALLQSRADDFPKYTKQLGKKLLKAGEKRSTDKGTTKPTASTKAPAKKPSGSDSGEAKPKRKRKKSYIGSTFTVGLEEPMKGRHTRIVSFIEDNMGEATGEELEAFLEAEGTSPAEHISFAIRKGYIVEAEDEL